MQQTSWFTLIFTAAALIALSVIAANHFIPFPEDITLQPATPSDTTTNTLPTTSTNVTEPNNNLSTIQTHTITLKVKKGDSLLHILKRAGIHYKDALAAADALNTLYDPARLVIGQEIIITSSVPGDTEGEHILHEMQLDESPTDKIIVSREPDDSFKAYTIHTPLSRHLFKTQATIETSLYEAAQQAGVSANHIMKLISLYSYDIDFQRDIRKGDTLEVLYEELRNSNDTKVEDGDIIYAAITTNGNTLPIYYYENETGIAEYYTEDGKTVRKSLLRTPVNGARLSSGYGMRKHPVLGYSKLHKGVDFAAPIGTPIYAAGNGTIAEIGRKGSFGNYIRIKHDSMYSTAYAHLHRFKKGITKGTRVKQGQVIGFVGKTGRATGAHLHYEIHKFGKATNPKKVRFQAQESLKPAQLAEFNQYKSIIQSALAEKEDISAPFAVVMESK